MKVFSRLICKRVASSLLAFSLGASSLMAVNATADDYTIDTRGAHAFIQFRTKHLGFSWLYGRFNDFEGEFTYDPDNPDKNSIEVDIDVTSIDSNHAERDKHLRGKKYLNVEEYPSAKFISTKYTPTGENTATLTGDFTLHGVTKAIDIEVEHIGGGHDPWGGYRHGFEGRTTINPADFGMARMLKSLGPTAAEIELFLTVEGIKKKDLKAK